MQKKLKSEGLVSRGNKDFFGIIYNIRMFFATAISIIAVFAVILAFTAITPRARAEDLPQDRTALEAQLKDLETQIAEQEDILSQISKKGTTLKSEITRLNANIAKLTLQVKAVTVSLNKLNKDIQSTTGKIDQTEGEISQKKQAIADTLRVIDHQEGNNIIEIMMKNPSIADFFTNINRVAAVQENLRGLAVDLENLKGKYTDQREELSLQKADVEQLKAYQEKQKKTAEVTQKDKAALLKETKGKEEEYQKILTQTKQTAAEIRSRIYRLIGGGEMTFAQAYNIASGIEDATGVRAALLLAILDQESNLGKNTGKCDYQTAMHPTRDIPVFLDMIDRLGFQSDLAAGKLKVSCAIRSDGAYGGAMGPSQFIPSTWVMYEKRIAAVTGHNPPNPWSNYDGMTATALYLKDAMGSLDCRNYSAQIPNQAQFLKERCAAAKYYAGGRWYNYRFAYGDSVLNRADGFEEDIAVLNNQTASR